MNNHIDNLQFEKKANKYKLASSVCLNDKQIPIFIINFKYLICHSKVLKIFLNLL